jgi:tetratricopeptide (TPR) repeat protein
MADSLPSEEAFSPEKFKLAEALARNPASVLFLPLAEEFVKAGRLSEAILILEEGLKTHPTSHAARVALGRAYYQAGDNAKARALLEEAVELSPENLLAHRTLAEIYVEENALGPAMRACSMLLAANPKDEEVQALKAVIERRLQPPLEFDVQELRQASLSTPSVIPPAPAVSSFSSSASEEDRLSVEAGCQKPPSKDRTPAWKVAQLRRWLGRIERRRLEA